MAQVAAINTETKPASTANLNGHNLDPTDFSSESIRNICILAHVDYGKTCIADSLLTLNGLVTSRSVGKAKYLDDRPDEQARKITMKSSAVSIGFNLHLDKGKSIPFLMNLVDTPGHVDFNSEVTAAIRICDGALIVVDVVEGVSLQTKAALKYAFEEKLKMILIINKLDRLILELRMPAIDMYMRLVSILEHCNKYVLFLEDFDISMDKPEEEQSEYFDPVKGNVIFASAIHNWGFTLRQIAIMYVNIVQGETVDSLTVKLWDMNLYVSSIDKCIKSGATERDTGNVFSQLVCYMLNHIYVNLYVKEDENAVPIILQKLGVDPTHLPLKYSTCKMKLRIIMEAWNSLAKTIAVQCYYNIPPPTNLGANKINYLLNLDRYSFSITPNDKLEEAISSFKKCSHLRPPIAYITKLFVNNKGTIPLLNELNNTDSAICLDDMDRIILELKKMSFDERRVQVMALVRIYSGVLTAGQQLTVLHPNYNPIEYLLTEDPNGAQVAKLRRLTIENVFLLLGSEYKKVSSLKAGYICAITCSDIFPYGCATLTNNFYTPPIIKQQKIEPIVYNVITPREPNQSQILKTGLQMLQQFDTSIRTFINDFGEYVLTTAGRVHLEKCLNDLKRNFVDVDFAVSPPIYSLRETVEQSVMLPISKTIVISSHCKIDIELSVVSLPVTVAAIVQAYYSILNMIQNHEEPSIGDVCVRAVSQQIRESKEKTFNAEFYERVISKLKNMITCAIRDNNTTVWNSIDVMNIMRIGNSRDNINLIINDVTGYNCNVFSTQDELDPRLLIYNYLVNAFNLACFAGPICKEPVSNCAFILSELNVTGPINLLVSNDSTNANYITQKLRDLFVEVLLKEDVAVMEPMLEASIQTDHALLGGIYLEVQKHVGQILPTYTIDENSTYVDIKAFIPAREADNFVMGLRKITAGTATVSMAFSHYKVNHGEECFDEGVEKKVKGKLSSRAERLVQEVRSRKGITMHKQVVRRAEKQRTKKK